MSENSAFLIMLRRLLTAALVLIAILFILYLGLIRFNRAASYKHGMAAINQARELSPGIIADVKELRESIQLETKDSEELIANQRLKTLLDSLENKQRQKLVVDGVKVSVYTRYFVLTNNSHLVPLPGNTSLSSSDRNFLLPITMEVLASQQDILLADIFSKDDKPTWALDPLELESRMNTNPGVLSWALIVNAPGGYEKTLSWVHQFLLLNFSFILLLVPGYVWNDARGRYRHTFLWTTVAAMTNVVGLLAYLIIGRITASSCPECHQAINDHQKFCPYCRVSLKAECLNCGQALSNNWRFCAGCGAKSENGRGSSDGA